LSSIQGIEAPKPDAKPAAVVDKNTPQQSIPGSFVKQLHFRIVMTFVFRVKVPKKTRNAFLFHFQSKATYFVVSIFL
jgi:hypothetical protein